jgi:uncharacterized membrane protein
MILDPGPIHFGAAMLALLLGLLVFLRKKGTRFHRIAGRSYVVVMALVNGAALLIYEDSDGAFGVFHYLALVSLVTITAGLISIRAANRRRRLAISHAYFMCWSYAGLAAAGTGQAAALVGVNILATVTITLCVGGLFIHWRIPKTFGR